MLSRCCFARSVALKWLPSGTQLFSETPIAREAPPQPPTDASSSDFFQKYMDVDNMVRRSFIEIENKYQKFFDAQQDIEIPLDGNEAKIQKYHDQLTKLRTQFEIPDKVQVLEMLMHEKKACSKGLVRKWVRDLEETWGDALFESMMGIVTDVESEAGTVLHFPTADEPDPAGWSIFKDKYEDLMKEYGLDNPLTNEEILYEDTKIGLERTVEHAQNSMDDMCEKLGINTKVDAKELKTTISRDIE